MAECYEYFVEERISAMRADLRVLSDRLHDAVRACLRHGCSLEDPHVQRLVAQRGCVDTAVNALRAEWMHVHPEAGGGRREADAEGEEGG